MSAKAANYASKIRRRQKNHEDISIDDLNWLSEYEKRVKRGRPRATPPEMPDTPASGNGHAAPPGEPPPSPGGAAGWPEGEIPSPPPVDVKPPRAEYSNDAPSESNPLPDQKNRVEAKLIADLYCSVLEDANNDAKREGLKHIPQALMDGFLKPCVLIVAEEYVPQIDPKMVAPIVVGAGSAFVFYQGSSANKIRKARENNISTPTEKKPDPPKPRNNMNGTAESPFRESKEPSNLVLAGDPFKTALGND